MKKLLIVEDDNSLREALVDTLELANYIVLAVENGEEALVSLNSFLPDMIVSDIRMDKLTGHGLLKAIHKSKPGIPVMLMTAHGTVQDAVEAMQYGAVDYLMKPFEPATLIAKIEQYALSHQSQENPIAEDEQSQALLSLSAKVARSDATVLISGESGTGKEVLARYVHDHSLRREGPFIAINCAAIPEQMLEATLFGYEKGAFTGAIKATPGKFEQAEGGTLLLDEISEMDLNLQAKLLRVLQEREVERIGGTKTIKLNVRVLATTNRDMKSEIANGHFREDLYYRLNVFPLFWQPLRKRVADILPLANYLIEQHCKHAQIAKPSLSKDAILALESYQWPGNTRELDNVIQRAIILHQGQEIEEDDLALLSIDQKKTIVLKDRKKPGKKKIAEEH
jgi:two-component system response regulator FlrC